MIRSTLTLVSLCCALGSFAQFTPAPAQTTPILVTGVTIHTGNGNVIENGAIGFANGIINFVGEENEVKRDGYPTALDYTGKHVYPGMIVPDITLGLTEIESVRATEDQRETGDWNPHVRSIIAFNTESKVAATVRTNGVLMAQVTPRSGRISGTSSVVQLDAWNWEDAVVRMDDGIHLNWPNMYRQKGWWTSAVSHKANKRYSDNAAEVRSFFTEAQAYANRTEQVVQDLRMESMRGLFDGSKTLYVHANNVKDIIEVVNLKRDYKLPNVVLVGGYDSPLVSDLLRENKIGVILLRVHSLPGRDGDNLYHPFELPAKLQEAGVLYCLSYTGDMEAMGCRNLPFLAGTAATYGLTKEQALSAVTLNTAKILGIDKEVGSLEVGKQATFFISTGDALDMLTNNVERAFIQGRDLELNNHQMELYERYKAKYDNE